jgi:hypothetical protein
MTRFGKAVAVVSLLSLFPLVAAAQTAKSIAGTYRIASSEVFGKGARGTLMLGADGRYSVILMSASMPRFASGARIRGTAEENKAVVEGSIAHFGKYTVDDGGKTLTFHVEASTFPNWDGDAQKRLLTVKGDELIYTVPAPSTGANQATQLTWKRVR